MRITPLLTVLFWAIAQVLQAQVVNIDFSSPEDPYVFAGLAAVPDPAGESAVWNQTGGSGSETLAATGLVDSHGNPTSMGIRLGINGSFNELPGQQELGGAYDDLMGDYVFLSAPTNAEVVTKSGTIEGLVPDRSYEVYFYSQGNNFIDAYSIGQNGLITVAGVSKQTAWDGIPGGDGLLAEGIEYVKFSFVADAGGQMGFTWANVVSGPGGNVTVDLDGHNSRFAALNGIQIVDLAAAIPEPAVMLLGSLGLLALLRRRK